MKEGKKQMIKKEIITMQSESWFDEERTHRYVLRKQWYEGVKEGQTGDIAVVVTIRPTNTSALVEDLSSMLIEKNIRQLGFTGFIAVNLFSSIKAKNKATFLAGTDDNTFEVMTTVLKEKRITQIIFACGSILTTSTIALEQAKKIYDLLSVKQKKLTKVLVNPTNGHLAHPLSVYSRREWLVADLDTNIFEESSSVQGKNDKPLENVTDEPPDV